MAKIFWVEDQSHWIDKFEKILKETDFDGRPNDLEVYKFSEAARQQIALKDQGNGPDIAILDANMSGKNDAGFTVSSALRRKWPNLPIIFLSEYSGTHIERDALEQFDVQDFISKHQKNVEEVLCWRIKAVLRHLAMNNNSSSSAVSGSIITSGALKLDIDTWEVYWHGVKLMNPDNPRRPLAPTPRKILRCLVERSPRPVTTGQIAEYLELDPDTYADATYRQHIKTLRRSLDAAEGGSGSFLAKCKEGYGIVTQGESNAYLWKPGSDN